MVLVEEGKLITDAGISETALHQIYGLVIAIASCTVT